jgi:hypothetical protein
MPFFDARAVHGLMAASPSADRLATAFALSSLVHTATYSPHYAADPRWLDAITPSDAGEELLARVSMQPIPRPDLYLALFGLYWYQDPLVDVARSDLDLVREIIEKEGRSRRLLWPATHGRSLYDAYQRMFPNNRDALSPHEFTELLEQTSQGIYQAGTLITGPLGIIDAQSVRSYPPVQRVGLWHCPMLDCGQLHGVLLSPPPIPLVEAYRLLNKAANDLWMTPSRWRARVFKAGRTHSRNAGKRSVRCRYS